VPTMTINSQSGSGDFIDCCCIDAPFCWASGRSR
jgi:hypothetical protein